MARFMIALLSVPRRSLCFVSRGSLSLGFTNTLHYSNSSTKKSTRRLSSFDELLGDVERLLAEDEDLSSSALKDSSLSNNAWKQLDWKDISLRDVKPSPVEERMIQGRRIFVKRDDLLRLPGSQISGNKARKMLALNDMEDFPDCLVSFGGPQSNSMLALAAICNYKSRDESSSSSTSTSTSTSTSSTTEVQPSTNNATQQQLLKHRFVYYTKKLPRFLRNQPSGNLFRAMSLGMEIKELSHQEYKDFFGGDWGGSSEAPIGLAPPIPNNSVWVPQGGACPMASAGVQMLAREIAAFWSENGKGRPLSVCVPGGTCSTAVLLHHQLKKLVGDEDDIQVVVIPCVGDAAYARRQMMSLSSQVGRAAEDIPSILLPAPDIDWNGKDDPDEKLKYYNFGEPDKDILHTFEMFRDDYDLSLDLIYGAPAWTIMLRHWNVELIYGVLFDPNNPIAGREVMYIHSGGLEGINSQLLRYKHKGLIDIDEIQFPGKSRT
jgi:1-aminocyclopropane-1-carboxylate deaminase